MKTAIPTEPTRANIAQILDLLAATPLRLESLIQDRTDKQLRQPLGPGARSCTEMLAHLISALEKAPREEHNVIMLRFESEILEYR